MNFSALSYGFSCLLRPSQLKPTLVLQDFSQLPTNLSSTLQQALVRRSERDTAPKVDIRALVLDKDNCFAKPHSLEVHEPYRAQFAALKEAYPGARLLVVSNTTGCLPSKHHGTQGQDGNLQQLQKHLDGPHILVHQGRKPGCGDEVMAYLRKHTDVTKASQVCVIGDRLFTDVLMANLMGAHSIWLQCGVIEDNGAFTRFERLVYSLL